MDRPAPDLSQNRTEETLRVNAAEDGLRLDVFLKQRLPWRSREHLKSRVREGHVTVNGEAARVAQTVRERDVVRVVLERTGVAFDPGSIPLDVLYEDDVLVAIDKPAGFVVHPVGVHQMDTIINALHRRYRCPEDPARDVVPKLAHRLDQYTSGLLLVAKRDDVRGELGRQFEEREVKKEYLAIVRGRPDPARGEIDAPIGTPVEPGKKLPMVVREDGEPSLTLYETERELGEYTLVRCRPATGRTHQIRLHLAYIGHPLPADRLYGDGQPLVVDGEVLLDRYPLHSASLTFRHPVRGEMMTLTAPLAADLARAVDRLAAAGRS